MNSIRVHPITAGLAVGVLGILGVARAQQPQHFLKLTPEQTAILRSSACGGMPPRMIDRPDTRCDGGCG